MSCTIQEGLEKVEKNAPGWWKKAAHDAVLRVAARLPEFTSDDVWDELGGMTGANPMALGPVLLGLKRAGAIAPVEGRLERTRRPWRHRELTVWQRVQP